MLNFLLGEEERAVSRQNIPRPTPLSLALEAWSSGARCLLGSGLSPAGAPPSAPRTPPPLLTCRSPSADPISPRRNEGSDSCLCGRSPHFINWRLERADGGGGGEQKEAEREARARRRPWPGVKGCGSKSAARSCPTNALETGSAPSTREPGTYPQSSGR